MRSDSTSFGGWLGAAVSLDDAGICRVKYVESCSSGMSVRDWKARGGANRLAEERLLPIYPCIGQRI